MARHIAVSYACVSWSYLWSDRVSPILSIKRIYLVWCLYPLLYSYIKAVFGPGTFGTHNGWQFTMHYVVHLCSCIYLCLCCMMAYFRRCSSYAFNHFIMVCRYVSKVMKELLALFSWSSSWSSNRVSPALSIRKYCINVACHGITYVSLTRHFLCPDTFRAHSWVAIHYVVFLCSCVDLHRSYICVLCICVVWWLISGDAFVMLLIISVWFVGYCSHHERPVCYAQHLCISLLLHHLHDDVCMWGCFLYIE